MKENGYEYKEDGGIKGRHFFAKGKPNKRTHYIHIENINSELRYNHILFRDYLNAHPNMISTYNQLKTGLAKQYALDRETYTTLKSDFIV